MKLIHVFRNKTLKCLDPANGVETFHGLWNVNENIKNNTALYRSQHILTDMFDRITRR